MEKLEMIEVDELPPDGPLAKATPPSVDRVYDSYLSGKKPSTITNYTADLARFAQYAEVEDPREAVSGLLECDRGAANYVVTDYRSRMMEQGFAPATINRRLASLRSLCKLARSFGVIDWTLDVPSVRSEDYRDTRGPGTEIIAKMIRITPSKRNKLILRLMFDVGLRRGEVAALDVTDIHLHAGGVILSVTSKGNYEPTLLSLPDVTKTALQDYLIERGGGRSGGPLILNQDGERLSTTGIYRIVRSLGRAAGADRIVTPHGIRHSAITRAARLLQGDMVRLTAFSRHKDVRTAAKYIDNAQDDAGTIAAMVAEATMCQACGAEIPSGALCGDCTPGRISKEER